MPFVQPFQVESLRRGRRPLRSLIRTALGSIVFMLWCVDPPGTVSVSFGNEVLPHPESDIRQDAAALADQYVSSTVSQLKLEAELAVDENAADRFETALTAGLPRPNLLNELATIDGALRKPMVALVQENDDSLVDAFKHISSELNEQESGLRKNWRAVRASLNSKRLQLFEVKASQQLAGQLAFLLNVDNRWFWLFGMIAFSGLVGVAAYDRRHEIRRRLNGGSARAMGLSRFLSALLLVLSLVTAVTFIFGDRLFHLLLQASLGEETQPRNEIIAENDKAKKSLQESMRKATEVNNKYAKAFRQVKSSLLSSAGPSTDLIERWESTTSQTRSIQAEMHLLGELSKKLQADIVKLNELQRDVMASAEQTARYDRIRQYVRAGLGLTLLGIATGGGVLLERGVRRRKEKISNTCPLCLGQRTFVSIDEMSGGYEGLSMVQCKNVISEQPYEECDFVFSAMYRGITKLCFPTLGIPQAGKTHWLAMVYRELNRGNYPGFVQFERIKSSSSESFDPIIDEILNRKIGPAATQVARIPHPLVFNFVDHDRLGASDILVNIFDYSGEVTRSQTLQDRQRQRALDGDGFFFFLDPTEPSETQSEALASFREDLRRIKGVKAGGQIRTPVALCVSKLDLMINEPYADPDGGGVVGNFYRNLGETGWNSDLASIHARSQLISRLRDTVWPGWQIERQIHDLFGGRYMFFPLSPVGLNGIGEADLARRTIAPVGLLEPLLWLLHMNGYPVMK
jgi:hypothetical protein